MRQVVPRDNVTPQRSIHAKASQRKAFTVQEVALCHPAPHTGCHAGEAWANQVELSSPAHILPCCSKILPCSKGMGDETCSSPPVQKVAL